MALERYACYRTILLTNGIPIKLPLTHLRWGMNTLFEGER